MSDFTHSPGGIIGEAVGGWLASIMKLLGASVLLFCLWVASISLFLGVSWISVMDRIGRWTLGLYDRLRLQDWRVA